MAHHRALNYHAREILLVQAKSLTAQSSSGGGFSYQLAAWHIDDGTSRVVDISLAGHPPGYMNYFNPFYLLHHEHFTFVACIFIQPPRATLRLLETQDNFGTVLPTSFPLSTSQKKTGNDWLDSMLSGGEAAYSLMDTSEGTVFINVQHGRSVRVEGNTYLSDNTAHLPGGHRLVLEARTPLCLRGAHFRCLCQ